VSKAYGVIGEGRKRRRKKRPKNEKGMQRGRGMRRIRNKNSSTSKKERIFGTRGEERYSRGSAEKAAPSRGKHRTQYKKKDNLEGGEEDPRRKSREMNSSNRLLYQLKGSREGEKVAVH